MEKAIKTEVIRLRVTPEFKAAVEQAAAKENRTMSNWIEAVLKQKLDGSRPNAKTART